MSTPRTRLALDLDEVGPELDSRQDAKASSGSYAVRSESGTVVAVVERKSLADLAGALNDGTLFFELAKLAEAPRTAVVVEDRNGNSPTLARVQVRFPEIAIVFLETRPLAEEWTFRYRGAALAEHGSERQGAPHSRAAESPADYATVTPEPSRKRLAAGA